MTDLIARVRTALGSGWQASGSLWEGLIRLYEADPEAFYLLACDGAGGQADALVQPLYALAHQVRRAIRTSYRLIPPAGGEGQIEIQSDRMAVPADLFPRVRQFLLEIDGKGVTEKKGKDYEGQAVSEAEVTFMLGDPADWEKEHARQQARRNARPFVLRLDQNDLVHLETQPAYVTHELLQCARKTVLAPTAVFKGLKRGGDAPPKVNNGWAFFGKPRQAYRNNGTPFSAPQAKVFVVYADEDGYVFDWDWVQEDPDRAGYPLGPLNERFNEEINLQQEVVLDLPKDLRAGQLDARQACYSSRGDCIFYYMTDEESYAERINADLTVFQRLESNKHTGFKIKNVRRILQVDKSIIVSDPPALAVSVDSVLLAVSRRQHESVEFYAVLIRRLHAIPDESPKVRVSPAELVEA